MTLEELNLVAQERGREIYGFCYYLSGHKETAEELYQDTFLKATEKCKKIKQDQDVKAYIIGISIRLWKNRVRKNSNRHRIAPVTTLVMDHASKETPLDQVLHKEEDGLVLEAVNTLKEAQRITLMMFYYWDLSVEDIAKILKTPQGTVKSRLFNGRKQVKQYLEDNQYER